MYIPFDEMKNVIQHVLMKHGMTQEKAGICARVYTESSYDGVFSHGTNRVARFVKYMKKGYVDYNADPVIEKEFGAVCIVNGNMGPGILNALFATERAMELADRYGIGMVGLKNTTHWMRGGTYGLHAAKKGYAAIMWTNTESVMPAWGACNNKLGNNPFVLAAPATGNMPEIVMDMAMSQYSYGKLQVTRLAGKKLPFPGGFDKDGNLTDDPGALEESRRLLPIGYWKGSSMAFMLDVVGALLSDGITTGEVDAKRMGSCAGGSQVFIVIDPKKFSSEEKIEHTIRVAIDHLKSSEPDPNLSEVKIPGDNGRAFRRQHDEKGVFVDDSVWEEILNL